MTDQAINVLNVVGREAADGYTVQKKAGLSPQELVSAVKELLKESVIQVEGDLDISTIGRAYIWVPPNRKALAAIKSGTAL